MHRRTLSLLTYLFYFFFSSLFFFPLYIVCFSISVPISLETLNQSISVYSYIIKRKEIKETEEKKANHFILILAIQYSTLLLSNAGVQI